MPDKLTALKIKQPNGTYSDQIPIGVHVDNIAYNDGYTLKTVLGSVDMTKGSLQSQINTKVGPEYVESQISEDVTSWLEDNVEPVGSAVTVDSSLTTTGSAADAKIVGDKITNLSNNLKNYNSFDILTGKLVHRNVSSNGVTFSWSGDICTVSTNGASTNVATCQLGQNTVYTTMPPQVVPGRTYYVKYSTSSSLSEVRLVIGFRKSNGQSATNFYFTENKSITIPSDMAQWIIYLRVEPNTTITTPITINSIHFLSAESNEELINLISSANDIAFTYMNATQLNQFTNIFDIPSNCYFPATGTKIKQLVDHATNNNIPEGNTAPEQIIDNIVYTVKLWRYVSNYFICEIISPVNFQHFIGCIADAHPTIIFWYDWGYNTRINSLFYNNSINLLQGKYRRLDVTDSNGISYIWNGDECRVSGATSINLFSAWAYVLNLKIPDYISSTTPLFLKYKTTKTEVKCRILYYDENQAPISGSTQYYYYDSIIYIPENAKYLSLGMYVDVNTNIGATSPNYAIVSNLGLYTAESDEKLTNNIIDLQENTVYNIFNENLLTKQNDVNNNTTFIWEKNICKIYTTAQGASGTLGGINHLISKANKGLILPAEVIPGKKYLVHFSTPNDKVRLIIQFSNSEGNAISPINYISSNQMITVPDNAAAWHVYLLVDKNTIINKNSPVIIDGNFKLLPTFTNEELVGKSNILEIQKPVYVALGASSIEGAVHYYNDGAETSDIIRSTRSIYNYPNYVGQVLGLNATNLAVGGSGLISRAPTRNDNGVSYYENNSIMDIIYQNPNNIFDNASLITLHVMYGNDANLKLGSSDTRTAIPIGEYNDYYPYDESAEYHPSEEGHSLSTGQTAVKTMIENKNATFMGCLNWCIKYLGDHYPLAQIILLFGAFPYNIGSYGGEITIETRPNGTQKLNIAPRSDVIYDVESVVCRLAKEINIPLINLHSDGLPYTYYSSEAKNANGDYILFSTVKQDGNKVKNGHATDLGYLLFARYFAGRIASYYYR